MKRFVKMAVCAALAMISLTSTALAEFDASKSINVISREDGSGTRGAFIELTGVEQKTDGKKVDMTTEDAQITNNTGVMLATVADDTYAIGYVSLGSMNDSVKAVTVEGVEATAKNVASGAYQVARPFNIAYKADTLTALAEDFIAYVMSGEGQTVINDNGYVGSEDAAAYAGGTAQGKLVIAGSSSVSPVMEKLAESYMAINKDAVIEIQTSDSTTGMTGAIDGACDIGMASRELKDAEIEAGLIPVVIAMDGIAVIVNNENPAQDLTVAQIADIYTGETTAWSEIVK